MDGAPTGQLIKARLRGGHMRRLKHGARSVDGAAGTILHGVDTETSDEAARGDLFDARTEIRHFCRKILEHAGEPGHDKVPRLVEADRQQGEQALLPAAGRRDLVGLNDGGDRRGWRRARSWWRGRFCPSTSHGEAMSFP